RACCGQRRPAPRRSRTSRSSGPRSLSRALHAVDYRQLRSREKEGAMATTAAGLSVEEIRRISEERGIEFYFAQFVDLHARPSAKLVPASSLEALLSDGAGFAGFAAGDLGQLPSDPDIAAVPALDSFTPVPWQQNLARFACDVYVEGEEWPYDPRTILRRQLARARARVTS